MIDVQKITSVLKIVINGRDNFLTEDQAEELCTVLEQMLYDEPTYVELSNRVMDLEIENERLKDQIQDLNATFEDKLDQRMGRRYI